LTARRLADVLTQRHKSLLGPSLPEQTGEPAPAIRREFWNEDCVSGAPRRLKDGEIDLIVTDPPYGIEGDTLHKHYNRDERFVRDGYVEVPRGEYGDFSRSWIREAARVLRPGGVLYVVSGYTNLRDILNGLDGSGLEEVNHLIWKYNFGVHTTRKYVSSHYHVLYYAKPGGKRTFNRFARLGEGDRDLNGGSLLYQDLEDVWIINREYKPGQVKNKNQLPVQLLAKILQYSSDPGDLVCDFFLGSFSTAKVAVAMARSAVGFELNGAGFEANRREVDEIQVGSLLPHLRTGRDDRPKKRGQPWPDQELRELVKRFRELRDSGSTKKAAVEVLCGEFERGRFAVLKVLEKQGQ